MSPIAFFSQRQNRHSLLILVVSSVLLCASGWGAFASPVNMLVARTAAERFVNIQGRSNASISSDWKSATITSGPRILNRSGRTVAYCFTAHSRGKYAGYVLIAGDTNMPPVLEWSLGPCPYVHTPQRCIQALDEYRTKSSLGKYSLDLLYATPGRTLALAAWQGGKSKQDVWLDINAATLQVSSLPSMLDPLKKYTNASRYSGSWLLLSKSGRDEGGRTVRVIPDIPWFSYFRSTHVTATGCALARLGASGRNEVAKGFLARLGNYIEHCLCDRKDKPMTSILTAGVPNFCKMRGFPIHCAEYVVRGASKPSHLDFGGYRKLIESGKPVVLTYSSEPSDARDYENQRMRLYSTSALGYGYMIDSTGSYALAYFPSGISGDASYKTLPRSGDKAGIVYVNWDAPAAGILAFVAE